MKRRWPSLAVAVLLLLTGVSPALAEGDDPATLPEPTTNTPAPTTTTPAAAAPADTTTGYFRVDLDKFGPAVWAGAWHKLDKLTIASDIYLLGTTAELDLGLLFTFGDLTVEPFVGAVVDFANYSGAYLAVPQLISWYAHDKLYFESWLQLFLGTPFDSDVGVNFFYTREFLTYKVSPSIAVGPFVELTYQINDVTAGPAASQSGITSLPIGAAINVAYGQTNSILLFFGYETKAPDGTDGLAGRASYIRTW